MIVVGRVIRKEDEKRLFHTTMANIIEAGLTLSCDVLTIDSWSEEDASKLTGWLSTIKSSKKAIVNADMSMDLLKKFIFNWSLSRLEVGPAMFITDDFIKDDVISQIPDEIKISNGQCSQEHLLSLKANMLIFGHPWINFRGVAEILKDIRVGKRPYNTVFSMRLLYEPDSAEYAKFEGMVEDIVQRQFGKLSFREAYIPSIANSGRTLFLYAPNHKEELAMVEFSPHSVTIKPMGLVICRPKHDPFFYACL